MNRIATETIHLWDDLTDAEINKIQAYAEYVMGAQLAMMQALQYVIDSVNERRQESGYAVRGNILGSDEQREQYEADFINRKMWLSVL